MTECGQKSQGFFYRKQYKSGKVRDCLKILGCRPTVSYFHSFSDCIQPNSRETNLVWKGQGKVKEKSGNFMGHVGCTPCKLYCKNRYNHVQCITSFVQLYAFYSKKIISYVSSAF